MINDIDLDVAALLDQVPDDHVVFMLRAGPTPEDFVYCRGNLYDMITTLANVMNQYGEVADLVMGAAKEYESE